MGADDVQEVIPAGRLRSVTRVVRALPWVLQARWLTRRPTEISVVLARHDPAPRRSRRGRTDPSQLRRGVDGALRVTGSRHDACLARSLALLSLLSREGRPAVFVSGVRRVGGRIQSHAWVEVDGVPVEEPVAVGAFRRQVSHPNRAERRRAESDGER